MHHTESSPRPRCLHHSLLVFGPILAITVGSASAEPLYTITDLGDLPGGTDDSWAYDINNLGQIVGWGNTETGTRAFIWEDGVMTPLATPDPPQPTRAYSINDSGLIAGTVGEWGSNQAAVWDAGELTALPHFPLEVNSGPFGVNTDGRIVGYSGGPSASGGGYSVMWEDGAVSALSGLPTDASWSQATGVNAAGQVCGWYRQGSHEHAYLWDEGAVTEIPALPGATSVQATEVNDSGHVIGAAIFGGATTQFVGFLWDGESVQELGSGEFGPDTELLVPYDLTNDGLVVGWGPGRAFTWTAEDGTRDLNTLIDASGEGWTLQIAYGVNELGQIVGIGLNPDGVRHGFLATPIPEPAGFIILTMLGTIGFVVRRK